MLNLELKVEEVQAVLNALSQLPFVQVAALIGNIRAQAEKQLANAQAASTQPTTDETQD
jgi:hypothetical protein